MMSANDFGKTDFKELLPKHIKSVKDLERLSAQMNIFNTWLETLFLVFLKLGTEILYFVSNANNWINTAE